MAFTAKDVQALRERTGCGMMDCKKALVETEGNIDEAIDILRKKGLAAAEKKSGRIAAEGIVFTVVDDDKKIGVILEVNSETDFVSKNDKFKKFVEDVAQTILDTNPSDIDDLATKKLNGTEFTVQEELQEKILTIGENLKIRRFARFEGELVSYIHGGGRIGVLVKFETKASADQYAQAGKDVAMQIAAISPLFVNKEAVPASTLDHEKQILSEQVLAEGKPPHIVEKIVMGKISKYYKENCLVEQEFVKNNEISVGKYLEEVSAQAGNSIIVTEFVRWEKGEGLKKREDNFADEVACMMK